MLQESVSKMEEHKMEDVLVLLEMLQIRSSGTLLKMRFICSIDHCNFTNCEAEELGGAVYVYNVPNLSFLEGTFTSNSAKKGKTSLFKYSLLQAVHSTQRTPTLT